MAWGFLLSGFEAMWVRLRMRYFSGWLIWHVYRYYCCNDSAYGFIAHPNPVNQITTLGECNDKNKKIKFRINHSSAGRFAVFIAAWQSESGGWSSRLPSIFFSARRYHKNPATAANSQGEYAAFGMKQLSRISADRFLATHIINSNDNIPA